MKQPCVRLEFRRQPGSGRGHPAQPVEEIGVSPNAAKNTQENTYNWEDAALGLLADFGASGREVLGAAGDSGGWRALAFHRVASTN